MICPPVLYPLLIPTGFYVCDIATREQMGIVHRHALSRLSQPFVYPGLTFLSPLLPSWGGVLYSFRVYFHV